MPPANSSATLSATPSPSATPEPGLLAALPQLRRLWRSMSARRKGQSVALMGLTVVASAAELVSIGALIPFLAALTAPEALFVLPFMQPFIAALGLQQPQDLLLPLTVLFGCAAVLAGLVRIGVQWASTKLALSIGHDLVAGIFRRTLHQPYTTHIQRNSSEVVDGIVLKVERVIGFVLLPTANGFAAVFIVLVVCAAVLVFQPWVAISMILGLGSIYGLIYALTQARLQRDGERAAAAATQRVQALQEGLGGIRDITLDSTHATFCARFEQADLIMRRAQVRSVVFAITPRFMIEALGMVLIASVALLMAQGAGGLGQVVPVLGALALAAQRMLPLAQNIYAAWSNLSSNHGYLTEVLTLVEQPMPADPAVGSTEPALPFDQAIELRNLGFAYHTNGPQVLRGVNMGIAKGARIGIVGTTGSGKSTLMDILMGLLPPTEGQLCVDGCPITETNRRAWQARVAHVPQAMFLADASVAANIAFGVPPAQIDPERVRLAAQRAQIAHTIEGWPQGYQTMVGERGVRLSGGQRQRLAIARALYKHADVLVFDEATSALDDATEDAVLEAIEALGPELTIILITHRLRPLRAMDAVWRVEGGGVTLAVTKFFTSIVI